MAKQVVTRTYTASIRNQSRVQDDLDSLGFAASKLWNVGRWTCSRIWDKIDHIPTHNELTTYLKTTNAMMTCILSQVSESFKNSLKRSTAGTATDKTEIRKRTRPATANTATSTRAQQSPSSRKASNSTLSTTESTLKRIEPERVLVGLRTVQVPNSPRC